MTLDIRRAHAEDAEIVALLGRVTFAETFHHLFATHPGDLAEYLDRTFDVAKIRRSLGNRGNAYWLARVRGLPVAFAKLKFPSSAPVIRDARAAQLQKIYVLREFLPQGIGRPLLKEVLKFAGSQDMQVVWLDVLRENTRAIRFYTREGFQPVGDEQYTIGAQTFAFHLMVLRIDTLPA